MGLAQTLPVLFLQGQTFRGQPRGLLRRPCGSRGSSSPGDVVVPPFPVTFPRSSRACPGSALPSSPCSKGQCPSALDQRWKQLQAPALMKPALESLSLGKGGVIQHKQLSGTAPALAVLPWPPPNQSQPRHEQNTALPAPKGVDFSCTTPSPACPGLPSFTWHNIPHFFSSSVLLPPRISP